MSKTKTMPLANSGRKISARICDYLVYLVITILLSFLCTFWVFDSTFTYIEKEPYLFSLMLSISMIAGILFWYLHFIIVPLFWKGQTLFMKAFKIRIYYDKDEIVGKAHNNIFKYQIIPLIGIFFASLLTAFTSFAFDDPLNFLKSIITLNNVKGTSEGISTAASVMIAMYVIFSFPIIGIVINEVSNKNHQTWIESRCELYIIDLKEFKEEIKVKNEIKKDVKLPGVIDMEELESISDKS
ncbi:MAG: RDD family protein [Mycoplasma sp.]